MKIKNANITKEQFENALNKVVDYVQWFDREYREKKEHNEFEDGQHLAYFTVLDTLRNQLEIDGVKLDVNLKTICEDMLK